MRARLVLFVAMGLLVTGPAFGLTINGDRMILRDSAQTSTWSGNVRVRSDTGWMRSDTLVVHYRSDTVTRTVARGHVRFKHETYSGTASTVVYDRRADTALLTGDATIMSPRRRASGDTIRVDLARRSIRASGNVRGRSR